MTAVAVTSAVAVAAPAPAFASADRAASSGFVAASGWRGGKVAWSARGEYLKVRDTRADGYAFVVTANDTRHPRARKTCRAPRRGQTRVCNLSFPEHRKIRLVASLQRGGTVKYAGSARVRS
ncbi:hypothetical protein ACWGJ2_05875 [Streptomyces sp. NPDC054796]